MTTKQRLAEILENSKDEYVSGNAIAEKLGITRAAIWKNVKALEENGYIIDAVQNKGYKLADTSDAISENIIRKNLDNYNDIFQIEVHEKISSTNTVMKEKAAQLPDWYTIISGSQEGGRGRRGRQFFSPVNTGVYISILVRLQISAMDATHITTAAAVAACRAIEKCTKAKPTIKWVNDVFVNSKKICGILTEASISMESGGLDWAVMGIGLNVYEPEEGFPDELKDIAGAITDKKQRDLRSRLAAEFMKGFYDVCQDLLNKSLVKEYKERSFLIGHGVNVIRGEQIIPAQVLDIDDECRLIVQYKDESTEALSSGEVSIRPEK